MRGSYKYGLLRSLLILLYGGLCLNSAVLASHWRVLPAESQLGFVAYYDGSPFQGRFHRYDAVIQFDPDHLTGTNLDCSIHMASVDTESRDRDSALRMAEWFDTERFPQASFQSGEIRQTGQQQFEVTGELKLKNTSRTITIPFYWQALDAQDHKARMKATVSIDRRDFDIGAGDWRNDDTIGFMVEILIDLTLSRSEVINTE